VTEPTQSDIRPGPANTGPGRSSFRQGKGSPVLLLHCNGSSGEEIFSGCPDVSDAAWIAPERSGSGRSDPPFEESWDPVSGAIWTVAFIERVAPEGVTLMAHSVSAGQALVTAGARHGPRAILIRPCDPLLRRARDRS
jgi:pimeloyl-ACP methyl ester carboxylesterase